MCATSIRTSQPGSTEGAAKSSGASESSHSISAAGLLDVGIGHPVERPGGHAKIAGSVLVQALRNSVSGIVN